MWGHLVRRLLAALPVLAVVAVVVFSLLHLAPGDPAALVAGDQATPDQIAAIRARLGLDLPVLQQFWIWLTQILHGDFGTSIFSNRPVAELFRQRLEPTVALTISTTVIAVSLAVPLGVVAAWTAGSWIDRMVMSTAVLGFSFPVFVIGYGLIYVVAIELKLLPIQGYRPIADGLGPFLRHLVLPSLALGLNFMALIARITRASVIEVLGQDHIRTARAKGLGTGRVLFRHALRNAAVPIVTIIGIGVALLLGGVVVTESVFAIPGLGRLVVDAILHRDFPVIQGVLLVFSAVYVGVNLVVDMLYVVLDPRIRY